MKVHSPHRDYKLNKITMTARLYNKQVSCELVDLQARISKSFSDKYPQVCMPALQIDSDKFIFGVHTIMRYIAGPLPLHSKFLINQQLSRMEREIDPAVGIIYLKLNNYHKLSKPVIQKARKKINQYCQIINNQLLQSKTFLIEDSLTIADISVYHSLKAIENEFAQQWSATANLKRWMSHMGSTWQQIENQ